jgi:superfamily II DNA or RNA helicase
MYDGTIKTAENVTVGDVLMGPDSGPRSVVSKCTGTEEMYRITPTKGEPYTVNASHVLSLVISGKNSVMSASGQRFNAGDVANITISEYISSSKKFKHAAKGWRTGVDFPDLGEKRQLPLPPYILGVWLGDGNSRTASICNVDAEVVAEWIAYAESIGHNVRIHDTDKVPQYTITRPNNSAVGRGYKSNHIKKALGELDLILNKHIPHAYKTASRQDRLQLLAGLIDTDGYLHHGHWSIVFKQRALAMDTVFLARSLGFAAYVRPVKKTCTNTGARHEYWSITISGHLDTVPCRVPRRQAQPRKQKKNVLRTGIRVEPVGVGRYYGFEIDGADRLFLLGDFTVTHNTVCFAHITDGAAAKGNRVYILVHRDELLRQASDTLTECGVRHGLISPRYTPDYTRAVQVASVQTLVRRTHIAPPPDLIVVDECHHATAGSWRRVLSAYPAARVLGVTATPARLDGQGLGIDCGGVFDDMVLGPPVHELITRGFLSRPVYYAPPSRADLSGIRKQGGDFARRETAARMDKPTITGDAVAHYRKICHGAPAVAFCASVAHAEHVAETFRAACIPAATIDGTLTDHERKKRVYDLGNGTIRVLTSCEIINEGFDLPVVTAAILLRPTHSLSLHLQQVGRVLRTHPGKACSFILDHVGNLERHGLAEEEREWSLDGKQGKSGGKKDADERFKQCPQCFAVHNPAPKCPQCGYEYTPKPRALEEVDGELQEIDPAVIMARRAAMRREQGQAETLQDLLAIAKQRGYKPGWAHHIYRTRQRKRQGRAAV